MTTKKKGGGTQETTLRNPQEITLEDISHYEWEIYKKVKNLVEKARKDQENQPDGTTVRVGKLIFMRGEGSMRPSPDFEKIWGVLEKEEYAPKKPVKGSLRIDFLD